MGDDDWPAAAVLCDVTVPREWRGSCFTSDMERMLRMKVWGELVVLAGAAVMGCAAHEGASSGETECASGTEVVLENGSVSGLSECPTTGLVIRTTRSACTNDVPEFTLDQYPSALLDELEPYDSFIKCESNADCDAKPRGYCAQDEASQLPATSCRYACETDDDCGAGEVCDCRADVGVCVKAECFSNSDCEDGPCIRFAESSLCHDGYIGGGVYYACDDSEAECALDSDCDEAQVCSSRSVDGDRLEHRQCQESRLCGI